MTRYEEFERLQAFRQSIETMGKGSGALLAEFFLEHCRTVGINAEMINTWSEERVVQEWIVFMRTVIERLRSPAALEVFGKGDFPQPRFPRTETPSEQDGKV